MKSSAQVKYRRICHFMFHIESTWAQFRQFIEIRRTRFSLEFLNFSAEVDQNICWEHSKPDKQRNEGKKIKNNSNTAKKTNECENQHKLGRIIRPALFEFWMKSFEFLDKIHEPSLLRLYALSDLFGLRVFHWNCLFFTSIAYLTFFSTSFKPFAEFGVFF